MIKKILAAMLAVALAFTAMFGALAEAEPGGEIVAAATEEEPGEQQPTQLGPEEPEETPAAEPELPEETPEEEGGPECAHDITRVEIDRSARRVAYEDLRDGTHRITGTDVAAWVCVACGATVRTADTYVEGCSYADTEGGASCVWCGHNRGDDGRHEHWFTGDYTYFAGGLVEVSPYDENPGLYHVCRYEKLRARKCAMCDVCGPAEAVAGETIEELEYHVWDEDTDTCAVCGARRKCEHDAGYTTETWTAWVEYEFVDTSTHRRATHLYARQICARCGEAMTPVEETIVRDIQPHNYDDEQVCRDCGYANICTHEHMVYSYAVGGNARFTPVDRLYHRSADGAGVYITAETCPDCGYSRAYGPRANPCRGGVTAMHRFEGGVCADCGYRLEKREDECDHPEAARYCAMDPESGASVRASGAAYAVVASDAEGHTLSFVDDPSWVCTLCGHREDLRGHGARRTVTEPHVMRNGYCLIAGCGYRCPHQRVEGALRVGESYYDSCGAAGHCLVLPTLVDGVCADCGATVRAHVVKTERRDVEPHSMADGVCARCGYECPHPDGAIVELLPETRTVRKPLDERRHRVVKEQVTDTVCRECGMVFYEEAVELESSEEDHDFVDGRCALCGYAPGEVGAWEDGFVDLEKGERLNGVCPADGLTVIQTAQRLGEALQPGVDAGSLSVSVVNIDKVLGDGAAALDALPVRDKLIVSLNFLGFGDAVAVALDRDPGLLSGAGRAALEDLQARFDAMDDAGRRAAENGLRRYFPMTDFEVVPGVTTATFNLDLRVAGDGANAIQRYSFHQAGSRWMLINIASNQ